MHNDGHTPKESGAPHEMAHTEPIDVEGPPMMTRRGFVRNIVRIAIAGALVPAGMAQVLSGVAPDAFGGGGRQPVITRDAATNAKNPITIDQLAGPAPQVITGEWNFLPAVVYKVQRTILEGSARARGYNTAQFAIPHPTEPEHAILVYEGKCKHLGCTVGWNGGLGGSADISDYNEDGKPDGRILCPCHQGQYDIYDLAKNVPGTPPPSPLNIVLANVGDYTDDATGQSYSGVIVGYEKLIQTTAREAAIETDGTAFALGSQLPEGA